MYIFNKKSAEAGDGNKIGANNNRASFKIKTKEIKTKKSKEIEIKSDTSLKDNLEEDGVLNHEELIQQPPSFKQIDENHINSNLNDLYNNDYIVKLLPILYELLKRTQDAKKDLVTDKKEFIINVLKKACGEGLVFEEPNVRVIFDSVDPYLNRLYRCNILTLLQMQPLSFAELAQTTEINEEIYPETIINKVFSFVIFYIFIMFFVRLLLWL